MNHSLRLTFYTTCVLSISIPYAFGEGQPESIESYIQRGEYSSYYDRTGDLPSGIAFTYLVDLVDALFSKTGEDDTVHFIAKSTGLDDDVSAEILNKMIEINRKRAADERHIATDLYCDGEIPKVYGEDALDMLVAFHDVRNSHQEQVYDDFLSGWDTKSATAIDAWVNASKQNVTHVDLDYKKIYPRKNIDVDLELSKICAYRF